MRVKCLDKNLRYRILPIDSYMARIPDDGIINLTYKQAKLLVRTDADTWELADRETELIKSSWTKENKRLIFDCMVSAINGYGYSSQQLLLALDKKLDLYSTQPIDPMFDVDNRIREIADKIPENSKCIGINYNVPVARRSMMETPITGIFTMFETTLIQKPYVDNINTYDFCMVPSTFLIDAFKRSGVTIPVYHVPLGVDSKQFSYLKRDINKQIFTFGTYAQMTPRKGADLAVDAFLKTFPKREFPNVRMHVKTSYPVKFWDDKGDDRVISEHTKLSRDSLVKLIHSWDCFVFPTHGEGFGLPPIEAMSTGIPAIVTNWGGTADFINENICYPLDYTLEDAWGFNPNKEGNTGEFANPSMDHLCDLMMHIYQNRDEASQKGKKASDYLKRYWNWDKSASRLIGVLDQQYNLT